MATGVEHYQMAEQLEVQAVGWRFNGCGSGVEVTDADRDYATFLLQQAQVHATLALSAATALNDFEGGMNDHDHVAWRDVAATKPNPEGGAA